MRNITNFPNPALQFLIVQKTGQLKKEKGGGPAREIRTEYDVYY